MKQKILILLAIFATLLLTGCGAEVTSKIKFEEDGSGSRTVSAVISQSDSKNLEGGIIEVDKMLEEASPEGVNLNRTNLDNGDALYEFTFFFDNIQEYNKKVESITGKVHNATWYTKQSIFTSDIEFQEEECTYDLISWALEAFKSSKYAKWTVNLKPYEIGNTEIYLKDELVYKGVGNPSFTKQIATKVSSVSIYNNYDYNNKYSKQIVMQFAPGDLERMNIEEARKLLNSYSANYKIDMANSTITFDLTGEEVREFILAADKNCKESDFIYQSEFSPFQKTLTIQESYNLGEFFTLFQLEYPYIYNYIKLPEELDTIKVSYTNQMGDVELPEGYQYAGAYRYDSPYKIDLSSNSTVDLIKVKVTTNIGEMLDGQREIELQFSKNGCALTKAELIRFYPELEDIISFSDQGDLISISFLNRFKNGKVLDTGKNDLLFEKKSRFALKNVVYELKDTIDVVDYLPEIKGHTWDLGKVPIEYQLNMSNNSHISTMMINGTPYKLKDYSTESGYTITGTSPIEEPLDIQIEFKKTNSMFYLVIIVIVFVIIVAGLAYTLLRIKRKTVDEYDESEE